MKLLEVRYVEWLDSTGRNGWHGVDQVQDIRADKCQSVGFVYKEDSHCVALTQSITDRPEGEIDSLNGLLIIPRTAITKSKTIRKGESYYASNAS